MIRLPATIEDLRGRRAARWIRESTAGQFDRYGPDAQRELQDRAIARLGLVDAGLEWSVAESGSTVYSGPVMRAMLAAAAAGEFDILVVAYVARWQRNLRQTLNLLEEDLHPAGVAVWFADEELLSSNERHWDQLVDEAKGADSWLRKHRRRVKEGLAAKLREKRDPGGRPPFGMRRNAEKLVEPDPNCVALVQRTFELAAARATDREVSAQTGIPLYTVRGMLNNPLYIGRLPDGRQTRFAGVISIELWNRVQAVRETRRRRDGRPAQQRPYALSMLHCAACGRRLIGDTGRYRHSDACPAFIAAAVQPKRTPRGRHRVVTSSSYAAAAYETIVRQVLERVSVGAELIIEVVSGIEVAEPDRIALSRIAGERTAATTRYLRERDAAALEATMARLDADERATRELQAEPIDGAAVVEYLRDLPRLWDDAPDSRRALAEGLFERIEVLGLRSVRITPTPDAIAHGLADAFRARGDGYGRGERI
jgi:DNA invertase Pin-like site-specific DNA recombinase